MKACTTKNKKRLANGPVRDLHRHGLKIKISDCCENIAIRAHKK